MTDWSPTETARTHAGQVAWARAGAGPDLVLLHGWPWSSYSWHRVLPELAARYRVYWYDMPGYGRSQMRPDRPTGLDAQGAVLTEMLDRWGLDRPRVLAHDLGGAVALRAHLLHGRDYGDLVLMNVVALRPWGSDFFDHVGRHGEAFTGLPAHIHRAVVEAYIRGALVNDLPRSDMRALVAPWLGPDGQASFYRQFAQADEAFTAALEPLFARMRCPVHILWGEADPWIPLARGRALHREIPGSTFDTLPGVGHMPQLEAPAALLKTLSRYL